MRFTSGWSLALSLLAESTTLPSFNDPLILFPILIHVGFVAGYFGSMLGLGGGWLTVPALQLFGLEPMTAVGTSLTTMVFNAAMGTYRYYKKKILLFSLGLILAVPSLLGIYLGKNTLTSLEKVGYANLVLKIAFVVLLLTLSVVMTISSLNKNNGLQIKPLRKWAVLGPAIHITKNIRIGLLNAGAIGLLAGFLAGLLGIGGGIVITPLLVILLGIGVVQAASASLVSVLTSSLLGSSLYWSDGHAVFIYAAFLALGTAVGSFLGTSLAPQMSEAVLKKVFACLTLLTAMALLSKEVMPTSVSLVILVFGSTLLLIVALSAKLKKSPD